VVSSLNEHLFGLDSRLGLRHCQSDLRSLPSHFPIDSFSSFSHGDAFRTDVRLTNHPATRRRSNRRSPVPSCILYFTYPDNETH